jgi:uncharacterized membrane protein
MGMRTDRWLIAALVFLVGGLWLTFEWGHGNVGLSVAFPMASTKLSINVFTTGWPVLTGLPLVLVGVVLMVIALIAALVAQFHHPEAPEPDTVTRLNIPFNE